MTGCLENAETFSYTAEPFGVTFELPLALIDEIGRDARAGFRGLLDGGVEVGGVLFGREENGAVRIVAFRPVACDYSYGPAFKLSENDEAGLRLLLAAAAGDKELQGLAPVGWYHSRLQHDVSAAEDDLAFFEKWFAGTCRAVLQLRPERAGAMRALAFYREGDGEVRVSPCGEECALAQAPEPRNPPAAASSARRDPVRVARRLGPLAWIAGVAALLIVTVVPFLALKRVSPEAAAGAIGLRVADRDGQLYIQWNRESPAVLQASRAYLEIGEGPKQFRVEIQPGELQSGSVTYSRSSTAAVVRMVLLRPGFLPVEESVHFLGAAPPASAAPLLPTDMPAPPLAPEPTPSETMVVKVPGEPPMVPRPPARNFTARATAPPAVKPPVLDAEPPLAPVPLPRPDSLPAGMSAARVPRPAPLTVRTGRSSGQVIWTGRLEKRGMLRLEGQHASSGYLSGPLPGRPASISVLPGEMTPQGLRVFTSVPRQANRSEAAGPLNGWNPTEYVWDPERAGGISVLEWPGEQNGWRRLILRSERRSYSVLVLRWETL